MVFFLGWLSADPEGNKSRAYCKVCNKTLHAHRISLLKHTVSLKHTRAFQSYATSSSSIEISYPVDVSFLSYSLIYLKFRHSFTKFVI